MSLLVTEHAATICGVILARAGGRRGSRRVRGRLVEGLLPAAPGRRRRRPVAAPPRLRPAARTTWWPSRSSRPRSADPGVDRAFMTTRAPEAIVSRAESEVVAVIAACPLPAPLQPAIPGRPRSRQAAGPAGRAVPGAKVVIGIGGAAPPDDIARSYDRRAAPPRRGGARPGGHRLGVEDSASTGCCCRYRTGRAALPSRPEVLGKLSSTSTHHKSEYLATLPATSGRTTPQRASRLLHVTRHGATGIKRIAGDHRARLDNYRDRLIAQVALEDPRPRCPRHERPSAATTSAARLAGQRAALIGDGRWHHAGTRRAPPSTGRCPSSTSPTPAWSTPSTTAT